MEERTLDAIGFYTLSDARVRQLSRNSPLWRCELLITDACNFRCPYCQPVEGCGHIKTEDALAIVRQWASEGLKNIRFSGGEPTIHKGLVEMVALSRALGIERVAISTNGSLPREVYDRLLDAGVNDVSISLDACCAADGDKMAGGIEGAWVKVVENIRYIASKTYVTVGVVLTPENVGKICETVAFASGLGVADIRVISAVQCNGISLAAVAAIPESTLAKHPILRYRVKNLLSGRSVRGLTKLDNNRCLLVLDDMAVSGGEHYPCIIYLRQKGAPIGKIGDMKVVRAERKEWALHHDTYYDPVCRRTCLDVCVDYNNRVTELRGG